MLTPVLGFTLSLITVCAFELLFRHEERAGFRYFKNARLHLDYYLLKVGHGISNFVRFISMDLLRQMMHYLFHTVLGVILYVLKRYEKRIQDVQKANRMHARKSRAERTTRNKLDEIAEHKIASALTEEEKRDRREQTLQNG